MKKFTSFMLSILLVFGSFFASNVKVSAIEAPLQVAYQSHVQNVGWQNWYVDGSLSGTTGSALRLEAIRIELINMPEGAEITYSAHVQNVGWQPWVSDGETAGTTGKSKRLEAIMIELVNMPGYSVEYQAHVQNVGWQAWVMDGAIAGTTGLALRLEAIRIRIVDHRSDLSAYHMALGNVNEEDYTMATWLVYQAIVDANVVTVTDTQDDIDAATAAILAAQEDLILIGNLSAYNMAIEGVSSEDYTTVTWADYMMVVNDYMVTDQDTQATIDAATAAILAAQEELIHVADMTAYNEAMADVMQIDYTPASWAPYQVVLNANVVDNQDSQSVVNAATANIIAAQAGLVLKLQGYYNALGAVDEEDYTVASWNLYEQFVMSNMLTSSMSQAYIDYVTQKIIDAQTDLLVPLGVLTAYYAALTAVSEEDYTFISWIAYIMIVDDNMVTDQDSQVAINAATAAIVSAQEGLVHVANLTAFSDALALVSRADYTTLSWSDYMDVLDEYYVTEQNTQAAVDAATAAVISAQEDLVHVANMTAYNAALAGVSEEDYSMLSWAAYMMIVDDNMVTNQDSQAAVNAATAAILAAQDDLVPISSLEAAKITVLMLGPIFVTDNLVTKAQALVDSRFTVVILSSDGTYINSSGVAILAGTAGTISFTVYETLHPMNTSTTGVLSITVFSMMPI